MSLLGRAVVAIWNDITPEGRDNFIEWHNREHIPERVAIPGFHRGRRYVAEYGAPAYFTLYEARDAEVLVDAPYLARLNNPTQWTREVTAHFRNTVRGVCPTVFSQGPGDGPLILTLRLDAEPGRETMLRDRLADAVLPPLLALPEICGVHLCIADTSASSLETAERKGRAVGVPNWIVLVEAASRPSIDAAAEALTAAELAALSGGEEPVAGLYRLEFSCVDADMFV